MGQGQVIERFLRCLAEGDWEEMARCLADDVVRVGPFGDTYSPKAAYVAFISELMPTLENYSMTVTRVVCDGRVGLAELSETLDVDGGPVETPEALVFELDDAGLISHISIYTQRSQPSQPSQPASTPRDWPAWARKAERALDVGGRGEWKSLFAPGATFADPATTTPTQDLGRISRQTRGLFPDWSQEITSIRGEDDWAVFEWVGRATYTPALGADGSPAPGAGTRIEMHGATIIEVDEHGLVTSWRDYLDRQEPASQLRAAAKRAKPGETDPPAPDVSR